MKALTRTLAVFILGAVLGSATVSSCAGPSPLEASTTAAITITDFGVTTEKMAWDTWDLHGGAKYLKVDPSRPFRVDFVGFSEEYPRDLEQDDLALVGKDANWYVFRASYND